jgi:protein kinase-like protein
MPFEIGGVVGDYEILDVLGKGGMGRVYRVRHVISNRVEAMKVLLSDLAAEAELGDRFLGEIRTLARLDHPNIAKLHTAFKAENQLVMVMEFIEGSTLADRTKGGALPLHEAQLCRPGLGRTQLCTPKRRHSPRYQTIEHHGHSAKRGETHGFWYRQIHGRSPPHTSRHNIGLIAVHVSGAGSGNGC